ncbi:hypothetical protein A9G43_04060 [Gilliamella sp. Occ3-1]|uniref:tail fiber assembly protein n=1 Tax=Gilliamella sp. Occ3-1 TaxID=3120253 RepID=UPI00080ED74D|nr:tail fiber assembly protein [Gilliamella apicola]OCG71935.1 hypothetical protein A9G43_04060 [Gilliamella apicola]
MINYHYDNSKELKPFSYMTEATENTYPPDNALRIKPEFKDGYWPCEKNGKWILVEDNRNKKVYNIETKKSNEVDYLGKIKDGFTLLEPFDFCKWDGKKWVLDKDVKNKNFIETRKRKQEYLIRESNEKIAILQDIIDLDMKEADEEIQLKAWRKYRILLTRVDVSNINVEFPEKPQ